MQLLCMCLQKRDCPKNIETRWQCKLQNDLHKVENSNVLIK